MSPDPGHASAPVQVSPRLSLFAADASQCPLRSRVGSCDGHHDPLLVTADAADQDDCPGHLGQDDRLLSQR